MKKYLVGPSALKGAIPIPPSKSHTMRAILFGGLANGTSHLKNVLKAPDTDHMIAACKLLGASAKMEDGVLSIEGNGGSFAQVEDVIYAGNSGLILRFITAVSALCPSYAVITGDHSIRHLRPMHTLLDALKQLGVFAVSARGDGYAPLIIKGPLQGGRAVLQGEDSQPVSSLLIAGALAEKPIELIVKKPGEKPWIDLTLSWLDRFKVKYVNDNYERYLVEGKSKFKAFDYMIPGDLSSAAFPVAAAIATQSELTIENVDMTDPQGDKALIFTLQKMGASIEIDDSQKRLIVRADSRLHGETIDINTFIDSITTLAVVACFAEGETRLVNAAVARQKECDRIHCIAVELKKMGADIEELNDSLIIRHSKLHGAKVSSHGDHRMAMSLAVAALGAKGETQIDDVECVSKTFPNFDKLFQRIGANIQVV